MSKKLGTLILTQKKEKDLEPWMLENLKYKVNFSFNYINLTNIDYGSYIKSFRIKKK